MLNTRVNATLRTDFTRDAKFKVHTVSWKQVIAAADVARLWSKSTVGMQAMNTVRVIDGADAVPVVANRDCRIDVCLAERQSWRSSVSLELRYGMCTAAPLF